MTATGTPWDNQLNDEILQPLSMHNTTLRPSREQMERMAQGHRRDGNDAPRWPVFAWYAAGGLRGDVPTDVEISGAALLALSR